MLTEIIASRRKRVALNKELYPVKLLERSPYFETPCVSLGKYLRRPGSRGIIAEFKRASPSEGYLNKFAAVQEVSVGYMKAGASALSILTEPDFFKGSDEDLKIARKCNFCPILRKDFIFDEYQVLEARSIGADVILLIASLLNAREIKHLSSLAHSLGMEVLVEIHKEEEIALIPTDVSLLGINNRNLENFRTDISVSKNLGPKLRDNYTLISESGISRPGQAALLRDY